MDWTNRPENMKQLTGKKDLMDEYLKWFCEENAVERNREDTEQRV